jgi:RNA polymerase sigma factor (sigma-70 family)
LEAELDDLSPFDMSEPEDLSGAGADDPAPVAPIPPLTRNGYQRRPDTDVDIRALLGLRGAALLGGFRESRPDVSGYRLTEALIFFLRRAMLEEDDRIVSGLFGLLYDRCRPFLRDQVRGFAEDVREDILASIYEDMTKLLLRDDDASDFLQQSFWLYLKRRSITAIGRALTERRRTPLLDDMTADSGEEESASRIDSIRDYEISPEERALIRDGLAQLPADLSELFVLRYMEGWRIGDDRTAGLGDASEPTLAERYGITPRAVRKRLARAEELLRQYRKDFE